MESWYMDVLKNGELYIHELIFIKDIGFLKAAVMMKLMVLMTWNFLVWWIESCVSFPLLFVYYAQWLCECGGLEVKRDMKKVFGKRGPTMYNYCPLFLHPQVCVCVRVSIPFKKWPPTQHFKPTLSHSHTHTYGLIGRGEERWLECVIIVKNKEMHAKADLVKQPFVFRLIWMEWFAH